MQQAGCAWDIVFHVIAMIASRELARTCSCGPCATEFVLAFDTVRAVCATHTEVTGTLHIFVIAMLDVRRHDSAFSELNVLKVSSHETAAVPASELTQFTRACANIHKQSIY